MNKYTDVIHQCLAVFTVAYNHLVFGIGFGWTAPILSTMQKPGGEFFLTKEDTSWLASLEHMGKIFGVFLGAIMMDRVGRVPVLVLSTVPLLFMWHGILFTRSLPVIFAIRLLFGFGYGFNDSVNSIYLGEVTSPKVRSVVGSVSIITEFVGINLGFMIATYLSYTNVAIVNAVIFGISALPLFWLRETPQFLLMRDKSAQAEKNFVWLRGVTHINDVRNEFEKITQNVRDENLKQTSLRKKLTSTANYKSVLAVVAMYFLTGAGGYYPMMGYTSFIFASSESISVSQFTILFGITQLMVIVCTSSIAESFNRRPVILISFSMAALTLATVAALHYVHQNVVEVPYFPWLVFVAVTSYACIFTFVFPAIFLLRAELFPLSVKAIGGCSAIMAESSASFLMAKTFMYVYANYGIYSNFLIFAAVNLVTVVFVYFVLPETKNKSLLEIQELLVKKK